MTPSSSHRVSGIVPKYAVIFRTHFWDAFAQRQLDRLLSRVGQGDVFVLVDESNGVVPGIKHDRVVRVTETDLIGMGLPRAGTGNLLWFNGDYPLYYFLKKHGKYDYYFQLEYDVALNTDVDRLVSQAAEDHVDFLGLTKGEPVAEWAWLDTCRGVYALEDIRYKLICVSLFSRRALETLFSRRLEMARRLQAEAIEAWPFCEGFIATEMRLGGFKSAELADYTDTSRYDTWPPYVESDLPVMTDRPVIHPVLDQERYLGSLLKYKHGLIGYLNINSLLHQKLRRLPVTSYVTALITTSISKALRNLRQHRISSN